LQKEIRYASLAGHGTMTLRSPKQTTRYSVYLVKE
jgi:hypothetical protein